MKKFMLWYLILNTMLVFAGSLPTRPPAKEISVRTNNLSVILNGALTTSNTVQEAIDWVDDNWHTNIDINVQYTPMSLFTAEVNMLDNKINVLSNWTDTSINTLSNTLSDALNNSTGSLATNLNDFKNTISYRLDSSYIYGLYPIYVTGTVYKIKAGSCLVGTNYVYMLNDSANISFVSPPNTNYYYSYVYINKTVSVFPTNLVFTNSYTAPTYNQTYRGWYNGENRCIGVLPLMSGTVHKFCCDVLGEWYNGMSYGLKTDSQNPDGYWQDTPVIDSIFMPTNITYVIIGMDNNSGSDDTVFLRLSWADLVKTKSEGGTSSYYGGTLWSVEAADGDNEVEFTAILPVYPSRALRWLGHDNNGNDCDTAIRGYRIWR